MKISIITITYNSEKTLEDTLNSVLSQKHRPLQYIIIDGKSNDNTMKIIQEYKSKLIESGIDFKVISEPDKGISDAFNKGILASDGDLIGIINSDDRLADRALEYLNENYLKDVDVFYGDCIIFNDSSKKRFKAVPKFASNKKSLYKRMSLFHPSTFIQSNTYKKYGLYSLDYKYCMDRDLILKIYSEGGNFKYINKVLAEYREGGVNQQNYNECAIENRNISVKYGVKPVVANAVKYYLLIRDNLWKVKKFFNLNS